MPRRKAAPVVATRSAAKLLSAVGFAGDLDHALQLGIVERRKVVSRWLYFESSTNLDAVIEDVFTVTEEQVLDWLLTPTPFLRYPVAQLIDDRVTADAVEVIVPEFIRQHRFGALPLLTAAYQPYLAIYGWDDHDEIARQIEAMSGCLCRNGVVTQSVLPEPTRQREGSGWKSSVLKHGEFLGLGRMDAAALVSWER